MLRRRAFIDTNALAANLTDDILDARADAFGHGLALVAPAALAAGVRGVVVSDERDAAVAIAAGFRPGAVSLDRDGVGASASAYGVDGVGTPVLSLVGEVIAVKRVPAGAGVSYGYTYRAPEPQTLALVGLGYADGVPRLASNRASVQIGEHCHPLVGRIAMDQLVVAVGEAPFEVGMEAVLFGGRGAPAAIDWAEWTERSALELTAGIASRVVREAR